MPNDQYFSATPKVASERREVRLDLVDISLVLTTDRGVFSADRVDPGTRVLLSETPAPLATHHTIADIGCGYGPIALAAAKRAPHATVWAIDVNERARELCALNAERNGLANVRVAAPDEVPADLCFDAIYSNPPIRIGKVALHELLQRWLGALTPGEGRAWLVVQKHLGADSLARWLIEQGWPTERIAARQAYRILEVNARSGLADAEAIATETASTEVNATETPATETPAEGTDA
ncbi:MAG: methyltransferase [Actinobacteria bacterium]|nr:methyltransferase [Actinomycetota bacterium]